MDGLPSFECFGKGYAWFRIGYDIVVGSDCIIYYFCTFGWYELYRDCIEPTYKGNEHESYAINHLGFLVHCRFGIVVVPGIVGRIFVLDFRP